VPPRGPAQVARMHWDPGPYWDWNHYMALLGAAPRTEQGPVAVGDVVTISPDFAADRQALVTDSPPPCHARPVQGTNFTFLRVAPVGTAPLLSDPALHGGPGTRAVEDWSDKAVAGRQYVVAAVRGGWVAIWYAGKQAWIDDPGHRIVRRSRAQPRKVTPAAGRDWIPVYGEAFPAADEYPAGIAPDVVHPLPYKMLRGQQYVVGEVTRASRYYARFDDAGVPGNHTLVRGSQVYLDISFNHRWAFVRLSDVRNA
jgi:hypothetical protein